MNNINCVSYKNIKGMKTVDLDNVLEILILYNKKISCVADIVFELFHREFETIIDSEIQFIDDTTNLRRLSQYIRHLSLQDNSFKDNFRSLCQEYAFKNYINLNILWWLDKNNIYHLEEYWATKSMSNINSQLKALIIFYVDNLLTPEQKQIEEKARDIFLKLLLVVCSQTSSIWFTKIKNIHNELIDDALVELMLHPNNAKLIGFVQILNANVFHANLVKDCCRNILHKSLSYEAKEKFSIFDAIEKQEMWTTGNFHSKTVELHFELLKHFSVKEIFVLIQDMPEDTINFRFLLTSIAVFVKKVPESFKQLKKIVYHNLRSLFTDKSNICNNNFSDMNLAVFLILTIRQACMENSNPEAVYSDWFTSTFGCDSVMRCGSHVTPWTLLLGALAAALPHEPRWVLRVHVAKSLRAPAMCNRDAQGFKDACKERLSKLDYCEDCNTDSEDFLN